mmetsp:Transcript_59846/g.142568  ORF Transcript_59846/g.142568 Transcript_59846/m.142568 type:complete len:460 (+) Transcript_59846:122-1501(+)|eukprot:CAMPEP_0178452584 /NCGR_PEP_ID=MMETSP0689_2-20121128/44326_1 /TAXON_ID=160604 /ORGANISM="Amphidinium massartii, Strain CS-259" /LENGTH=459 /DNA_ID=CAMNT_0020078307 /DNA_START=78 /DNA_END=1457 /DNA_ORIENTATION=-
MAEHSELVLSMVLAACGGSLTSMAVNVSPSVLHFANRAGVKLPGCATHAINAGYLCLVLSGVGICVLATYFGPVALTMPSNAAASLLVNMLVQGGLGIKRYTSPMKAGTFVLVAAAISLGEVGPTDPEDIRDLTSAEILFDRPLGSAWLSMMAVAIFACAAAAQFLSSASHPKTKLVLIAFVDASSTAAAWSLQKILTMTPLGGHFAAFMVIYLIVGFFSLASSAQASWQCDMALYLPVAQSLQFVINALTGLVVWGDAERMRAPVSYAMALCVASVGACLTCSEGKSATPAAENAGVEGLENQQPDPEEARGEVQREHCKPHAGTATALAVTPGASSISTSCSEDLLPGSSSLEFKESMADVEHTWSKRVEEGHASKQEAIGPRLEAALRKGFKAGCVDVPAVLHLCASLGEALVRREEEACADDVESGLELLEHWYAQRVKESEGQRSPLPEASFTI